MVKKGKGKRWRRLFPFSVVLCPCLSGCAGFWDDVTSRDFDFKSMFVKPNPLVVLRDSNDGDKRANALRALHEPNQNGGTKQEQDMVVNLLVTAAKSERQPLCRLAAIESLGHFQDPRAAEGLKDAFYAADNFASETTTIIRCQCLTALGETKNPGAVDLLVKIVREPTALGSEQERQQQLDLRIAAARALGNFNQPQGVEALVHVLDTEKDIALRDRAHESLQVATGKKLPPDAKAWEEALHPGPETAQPAKKGLGWF